MFAIDAYLTSLPTIPAERELETLTARLFGQVFRHSFANPGFGLVKFERAIPSRALRRLMLALKQRLSDRFHQQFGRHLVYLSLCRFNQQNTTKFHLDGAPPESFLMLGYEPSEIQSSLAVADYSRAAFDMGILPDQFSADFNPMFREGAKRVGHYATRLEAFDPGASQILLVNNSSLPYVPNSFNQLGVMHQATIENPSNGCARIVNSTMLGTALRPDEEVVAQTVQEAFTITENVAGKLY